MTTRQDRPASGFSFELGMGDLRDGGAANFEGQWKELYGWLFDLEEILGVVGNDKIVMSCDLLFDEVIKDVPAIRARVDFLSGDLSLPYTSLAVELLSLIKRSEKKESVASKIDDVRGFLQSRRFKRPGNQPEKSVQIEKDYFNAARILKYFLTKEGILPVKDYDIRNEDEYLQVLENSIVPEDWESWRILTNKDVNT